MNNASAYPGPWDWSAQPEPVLTRKHQGKQYVLLWRAAHGVGVVGSYTTPRGALNARTAAATIDLGGDWRVWNTWEGWPRGLHPAYPTEP